MMALNYSLIYLLSQQLKSDFCSHVQKKKGFGKNGFRKNQKNSDTRKIAVIALKLKQCGFTTE